MQLEQLISDIVKDMGFSEEDKEEVTQDLVLAINARMLQDMSEDARYTSLLDELKQLESSDDFAAIEAKLSELSMDEEYAVKLKAAFTEVIKDWMESVSQSLSQEKRDEIVQKLKTTK